MVKFAVEFWWKMLLTIFPRKRSLKISFQTSPEVRHQFRRKLRQLHSGNRWCLKLGVPERGCFKPGCLQYLRGGALLRPFALFSSAFFSVLAFAFFFAHSHSFCVRPRPERPRRGIPQRVALTRENRSKNTHHRPETPGASHLTQLS